MASPKTQPTVERERQTLSGWGALAFVILWFVATTVFFVSTIQDAADGEMPTVSNVACDRFGRLFFHGRLAKFDPAGVLAGEGVPDQWEYVAWEVGDLEAVLADPPMARLNQFAFNRGLSKIINQATSAPMWVLENATTARPPTPDPVSRAAGATSGARPCRRDRRPRRARGSHRSRQQ